MVDRDVVRSGYDQLATAYAESRATEGRELALLQEFLVSLPEDTRLLDAGCGPGGPLHRTVDAVATAIGLDFSREQLERAAESAPDTKFCQGDMAVLPFVDDVFDAALAFHSLIHVPLDAHQDVLDEFARVLAPGGRVLLTEGTEEWTGTNPDWLESGVEMQWEIAGAETTREQLDRAGFQITDEWSHTQTFDGQKEQWVLLAAELED